MFDYEELFKPFTGNGATLEKSITWVKKSADVNDKIMDQVVADAMNQISQGEKFALPCSCGCGLPHVNVPIEHFMLAKALDLKKQQETAFISILENNEKQRIQARMKSLSNFEKEYFVMMNGKWYHRLWQWLTTYEGIR